MVFRPNKTKFNIDRQWLTGGNRSLKIQIIQLVDLSDCLRIFRTGKSYIFVIEI